MESRFRAPAWFILGVALALSCPLETAQAGRDVASAETSDPPTGPDVSIAPTFQPDWLRGSAGTEASNEPAGSFFGADRFALDFVGRLRHDYRAQATFPFQYARREPMRFLLGAAGFFALVVTDHRTHQALASRGSLEENRLIAPAEALSQAGKPAYGAVLVAGIGALGILIDSPRERQTGLMLAEALLTSATWTELIKKTSGRERPREREEEVSDWEGPGIFNNDSPGAGFRSFPSGHSSGAWAIATILAHQYPSRGIVPVLSYGGAIAMSYSRMAVGAHWLSDVVVGALIGYGCAKQVLSAREAYRAPADPPRVRLGVDVTSEYRGLSLNYDF